MTIHQFLGYKCQVDDKIWMCPQLQSEKKPINCFDTGSCYQCNCECKKIKSTLYQHGFHNYSTETYYPIRFVFQWVNDLKYTSKLFRNYLSKKEIDIESDITWLDLTETQLMDWNELDHRSKAANKCSTTLETPYKKKNNQKCFPCDEGSNIQHLHNLFH